MTSLLRPADQTSGQLALLLLGIVLSNACGSAQSPTPDSASLHATDSLIPAQALDSALLLDGSPSLDQEASDVNTLNQTTNDVGTARVPYPFANRVVSFTPGAFAGYGQDKLPDVVLGPPHGGGANAGSLDVLSLGYEGCIVLEFTDMEAIDGQGTDLLVFENPFGSYDETGIVSVSQDGITWATFPCAFTDKADHYPGCAGTHVVYSSPGNGIDPTDPTVAGGDPYDLHDVGLSFARFVRVCDSGQNSYAGTTGGFDLDAMAVVHGQPITQ